MDKHLEYAAPPLPRRRRREQGRDPYDGLRPWSAVTHGVGAVLALGGTVLLVLRALTCAAGPLALAACLLYGVSMTGLYTASTLYHCLRTGPRGRIALRKYDHISIYYLIAGSYTPVCLLRLSDAGGIPMLCIVWAAALAGTVLSLVWIDSPRWITAGLYLLMGWLSLFMLPGLLRALSPRSMTWLVLGGVLYTAGGVLYAVKWPGRQNPRFGCHEVFHVFILLGSVSHYLLMYSLL